ncbi:unnamed protein product [Diatraea saccharalis]|uniref:Uncharacterized protein n=1 Tax=Diatraea saccharalis TaxID=40085 RepID=A0A9N9R6L9_9NEOP|nr:unnamed protein product [Diatraea saccharalis]
MQRNDRWPDEYEPDTAKSRPTSRRNSASLSRRNSVTKKEKDSKKKSSLNTSSNSANSTPKKVSDFEDNYSKYGLNQKFNALATSTPKLGVKGKPRSGSLQNQLQTASCCSWQDCSEMEKTAMCERDGEWSSFWANYNNSLSKVPVKNYYDQCPTPYRTENIDLADLELSTDGSRKRSPDNMQNINYIIRNEGLHLTPRETQNMIKCAHILGNVLSKAIERRSREKGKTTDEKIQEVQMDKDDPEIEIKKKTLTLELKETNIPADVQEEKRSETVTTQTDISLPNTKSAPKIFEKILRQLSKTSLDESLNKIIDNKALDHKDESTENNEGN